MDDNPASISVSSEYESRPIGVSHGEEQLKKGSRAVYAVITLAKRWSRYSPSRARQLSCLWMVKETIPLRCRQTFRISFDLMMCLSVVSNLGLSMLVCIYTQ